MLFPPDLDLENAIKFSRFDTDNPLSTCSEHPILLEGENWLTCEHYVQAKSVRSKSLAERINKTLTGREAHDLAKPWYRWKVANWKKIRLVLMTRALYTKVQMYDEVREALLATEDSHIIETSQYDYYWGIGRDLRGENQLGKIWMDIRLKINHGF